ncbi:uncharacterized protein LOC101743760 [Bombyx mori]
MTDFWNEVPYGTMRRGTLIGKKHLTNAESTAGYKRWSECFSVPQRSNPGKMKVAIVFMGLIALGFSLPQPKKSFVENFRDFLDIIKDEAGHDIEHLFEHYIEFEEFQRSFDYLTTKDFRDLIYEMEDLPEFKAVVDFLENDNIDIHFFIDIFNEMIETIGERVKRARHTLSGRDFTSYINDIIGEFPKDKLAALYEQKLAEDEEFRVALENLQSEEWDAVFGALWESEQFKAEVDTLAEHGIDVHVLMKELFAIFGQNYNPGKMKVAIVFMGLIALGFSVPRPKKSFVENFGDFLDIIKDEAGNDIDNLFEQYIEFEEFRRSLDYLTTKDFRDLIYEMEDLPEFKAVVDFLENDNIEIHFFIDIFNEMMETIGERVKRARQTLSGRDFTSYINDIIDVFPKDKLAALYEQKLAEDEEFRVALENLQSEEWDAVFGALWESEQFKAEVDTLAEHGIDIHVLMKELFAIFGQN